MVSGLAPVGASPKSSELSLRCHALPVGLDARPRIFIALISTLTGLPRL